MSAFAKPRTVGAFGNDLRMVAAQFLLGWVLRLMPDDPDVNDFLETYIAYGERCQKRARGRP